MVRVLMFVIVLAAQVASAQIAAQPEAVKFDEFGKVDKTEFKERTQRFRDELIRLESDGKTARVHSYFIYIYRGEKDGSMKDVRSAIANALFESCWVCRRYDPPRITFLEAGVKKNRLIQFWIGQGNVKPPKPD